jgi:hypothetical protein
VAVDRRRLAPVPRDHDRPLRRRLAGRRRHDDRPHQSQSPTCFPPTCFVGINEGGTGYSWADRQTGWDEIGRHSGWRNPSWIDADTVMISDPTHIPNHDVILDTLSDGSQGNLVKGWFSDMVEGNPHVSGGDITRDRTKLAFATGENDSTLSLYAVSQFPASFGDGEAPMSARPTVCYRYSGVAGSYSTPTFAPDGTRLAWAEDNGIKVVSVPSFAGGWTTDGATPTAPLVIPGGSQPDWGPAGVPTGRGAAGGLKAKAVRTKLGRVLAKASASRSRRRPPAAPSPRPRTGASRSPPAPSGSPPARPRSRCASAVAPARRSTTRGACGCG